MNDNTDKLSSLMDGELRDLDQWSKQLANDADMRARWQRYHIARDVLKGQLSDYPQIDISSAVHDALQQEPAILAPFWKRLHPRTVMKQVAGLAVAATVATVAVLTVQQLRVDEQQLAQTSSPSANSIATAEQQGQLRQVSFTTRQKLDAAVESKLSGYLVNHNEYARSIRVSGVMPYSRIVSYVAEGSPTQQEHHDQ